MRGSHAGTVVLLELVVRIREDNEASRSLMNFLAAFQSPEPIATLGWLIGALGGAIFDVGLLFAIGSTPRLREHGRAPPMKPRSNILLRAPVALMVLLWLAGWFLGGSSASLCYVIHSALAATLVAGGVVLPLMVTAANHIARRSLW